MKTNPLSTQSKVRSVLKASDVSLRISEIRDRIGLSGEDGYARVNRAITDLIKARQAERYDRGRYRYLADKPDAEYCKKQRVMQRIMWMRSKGGRPFTARHIAETANASLYMTQKYIAWLAEKGVLRKEGKVQVAETAYAPLYLGDDEYLASDAWPIMRTPPKARELDAAIHEMHELAQRFFAVEGLDGDTLSNLQTTASRLGELVSECGKLKCSR